MKKAAYILLISLLIGATAALIFGVYIICKTL